MNKQLLIKDLKKVPRQMLGFLIMAFGISLIKSADIGMNAWSTLQLGISKISGLPFGTVSQLVGLVIITICFFIKIYPGIGTLFNMFFIGFFINCIELLNIIPIPSSFVFKLIFILFGQVVFYIGAYTYISCGIGAGPRDALFLGLVKITGKSVTVVRTSIEICVFVIGFLLGGKVGIGTVIITLSGGWILNKIFEIKNYDARTKRQSVITDYFKDNEVDKECFSEK